MSSFSPSPSDYNIVVTPSHEDFRSAVREFVKREIEPLAAQIDRTNQIPEALIKKIGSMGLFGIVIPQEHGGVGADTLSLSLAIEEVARASAACSALILATYLVSQPILQYGTREQKEKYLKPIAMGEKVAAHAMTEPAAGSDVAGIQSRARLEDDSWVLNGTKHFITNGGVAEVFLIFARTAPPSKESRHHGLSAFMVERSYSALKVGGRIECIGLRGAQPVQLTFDELKIPKENLLGELHKGAYIALQAYDLGRITVASQGVGLTQAALDAAMNYSRSRLAFNSRLMDFQQVQFKLSEMAIALHAARLLTYWAASLRDQRKDFVKPASLAKVYATEAAEKTALLAMMIHGGYGVASEYPVERYLRDSQIIKTYEGTNDIQRLTIAKELIKEHSSKL